MSDENINLEDLEQFGDLTSSILSIFGLTKENVEVIKSALNSVKKTEYADKTIFDIDLQKVRIIITK